MATSKKATGAKSWKKAETGTAASPLDLPSGNTALVRRPGLPAMVASGLFPDSLSSIAQQAIEKGKNGKPLSKAQTDKLMSGMITDPEKMASLFDTFDKAAAMVVEEPTCLYHKREVPSKKDGEKSTWVDMTQAERAVHAAEAGLDIDDIIWTDEVDLDDKMFIFNWCVGGSRDLETFREQLSTSMESLELG